MSRIFLITITLLTLLTLSLAVDTPILTAMQEEIDRAFDKLKDSGNAPVYYMSYTITDVSNVSLLAQFGALESYSDSKQRYMDVEIRVGDFSLDNTHPLSEFDWSRYYRMVDIPTTTTIDDDIDVIKHRLWLATEDKFRTAQEDYIKVLGDVKVKVEQEDTSGDFSPIEPETYIGEIVNLEIDSAIWADKIKKYSEKFIDKDFILYTSVRIRVNNTVRYFVTNEGTKIRISEPRVLLSIYASTKADDGMSMYNYESVIGESLSDLPSDEVVFAKIDTILYNLEILQNAPVVEPYTGPAILKSKAAGVFFHEIFGHRVEGHRQKNEKEGQTFTKKVGKEILPDFISIYDDASMERYNGTFLNGYYKYDDEGVKSRSVHVVENGILRNFLMSRNPIENFQQSNGHGRKRHGYDCVARQGNLIVESNKTMPFDKLKKELIKEVKAQGKEWGLIFDDISGGFTMTMRYTPQAFKVIPLRVWRVYVDGRPDELVRGVDIVGTPLTSFSKIIATGDDTNVFNGLCGAESGMVNVSAVSPSILVSQIEVEKKYKSKDKPPILDPPERQ